MNSQIPARILIVEDENIVAKDIQNTLKGLGYEVTAIVASGEDAILKAAETRPDLVLMDIMLKGYQDGVEAAQQILALYNIPVIYLTAYTDEKTLQRAKVTEPYGYILKPFEERELHIAIEMAIHKHQMSKKLREREQWLTTILKSISDAVIVTDAKGAITFMNPIAEALTGWTQREALGKELAEVFKIVDPETHSTIAKQVRDSGDANPSLLVARDGRETHIDDNATPIRDENGNLTDVVLVFRDISERKRAEEKLQQQEQQLRQSQKMEAMGKLAGGVAHDFNNMLTAIIGMTELAMLELHRDHPVRKELKEIKQLADRATLLTRQLLTFARQQIIAPVVLNLNDLLLNLDKMLRRLIGEDIELVLLPSADPGLVKVDSGQIEQVIVNLAINARDAMPQGGTLTLETSNVTVDQKNGNQHPVAKPGDYVMLVVRDTGIGMTEETKSHLFEPFFSTKEVGKGTGLGLATCYGIIQQNNGHIAIESETGQGTTVRIYLPRVTGTTAVLSELEKSPALPQGTETVLLVEDEPTVREVAARVLREQGYHVLMAANGDEALQLAKAHPQETIHLLVTDVVMPRLSGKVVADQLKVIRPDMKVLFISGYSDETTFRHGTADASLAFLQKPFSPAVLAHKVREVLDK
ncbi:MAG: response regulator [candidate division KSB1 bacterium]|nr:response regulator [candidate division KSB1 bacterium]MDZ7301075.1 response regulator [candidate division KSB1 bacterium]MDZ7312101.1 response regulator [candidate division KSB1 bacterium]